VADAGDRAQDILEILARLDHAQLFDPLAIMDGLEDARPLACCEVERRAHRLEREQDVGEQDGGVHAVRLDRLQGDLGREIRLLADLEQRVFFADLAVLRHVAARLTHEPDRRDVYRLAAAGTEKSIPHVSLEYSYDQRSESPERRHRTVTSFFSGYLRAGAR
jgi:hypothetical protein